MKGEHDEKIQSYYHRNAGNGCGKGKPLNRAIYDEDSGKMIEIMAGDFLIVYAPATSENYESLPPELNRKYKLKFYYPQTFLRINGEIKAIPYRPKKDEPER
jgi:hypothetical protein